MGVLLAGYGVDEAGTTGTVNGTDLAFGTAPTAGEVNTIEARGNNDFSLADVFWINRFVYDGATALDFG
eukprot:gene15140-20061_t